MKPRRASGCQAGDGTFEFVDTGGSHVTFTRVGTNTTVSVKGFGTVGPLKSFDARTGAYQAGRGGGKAPPQAIPAINAWMGAQGTTGAGLEQIRRERGW